MNEHNAHSLTAVGRVLVAAAGNRPGNDGSAVASSPDGTSTVAIGERCVDVGPVASDRIPVTA